MGASGRGGRGRWALVGLAAYGAIVVVILVAPISYSQIVNAVAEQLSRWFGLSWFGSGWIEFAANILMFVPLGFLLALLIRPYWAGVGVALLVSAGAELVQMIIPSRVASLRDILANVAGAAVGAGLAWLLVVRRDGGRAPGGARGSR
ncbi:VanZ family protein [Microbacterium sp. W1N]|uniref:VanZ family protein n=1 Tax=Microbacterium festucae TaxID=2977531 RepID=UPI0021C0C43A|nr:VanZ family protein [Microbacterium festucae]MCT9818986.1 VanZ family protein [Microbacterium festucae]